MSQYARHSPFDAALDRLHRIVAAAQRACLPRSCYLAGYVTPWPRAFAAEAVYWLSWALLAPAVFWMCRRLHAVGAGRRYAPALLLGAIVAATLQPLIPQSVV